MAGVLPIRGIRFDPGTVHLGGVLAPPYDVIDDGLRDALYARDLRNVVRIDYGAPMSGDVPGRDDQYTRAAAHLESWLELGVLVRDSAPSFYVTEHQFRGEDGGPRMRRGLIGAVRAVPWESSDLRPHEHTLRGPKEDRLALMRATRAQTSPVFGVWRGAPGMTAILDRVASTPAAAGGRTDGEMGSEKHLLWPVADAATVAAIVAALEPARLYVADGHHRYETAAAYAAERAAAGAARDDASQLALVYLAGADDSGIILLPTHRLVRPRSGLAYSRDDLWTRLDDAWELEGSDDLGDAAETAGRLRETRHAFAVRARDGSAVLSRARRPAGSPGHDLDVAVLEREVLAPAGLDAAAIRDGALAYTRSVDEVERAVAAGDAVLGFAVSAPSLDEVMAVADAGEVMPQKSTYFYPKVPTGLAILPL